MVSQLGAAREREVADRARTATCKLSSRASRG
jgi:hypothetical protein